MKFAYQLILYLVLFATPAALAQTSATPPDATPTPKLALTPREIAQRTLPSVVLLVIDTGRVDARRYGSGFFISHDVVATNFHMLEGAVTGVIKVVGQNTTYEILGTIGLDIENDLALLKVKGARMQPLPVGNSSTLVIGDDVFAVGNPKGLEGTFSQGIVSSIRRDGSDSVIQITAPISPGSSGGPVLNAQGEVVGVAVGGITSGQALNFAIPASYLKTLIANPKALTSLYTTGQTARRRQTTSPKGSWDDGEVGAAVGQAAPRPSGAPRMSNESIAINRAASSVARTGSRTSLEMTVTRGEKKQTYSLKPGDCTFESQAHDYNRDGAANGISVEVSCVSKANLSSVRLDFTVMSNQRLEIGGYPNANWVHPKENAAGMHVVMGSTSGGSRVKRSFQIHQALFDFTGERGRILNLAISFEESSPHETVNGTLYLNYAPPQ